jgi:hypothetical protein
MLYNPLIPLLVKRLRAVDRILGGTSNIAVSPDGRWLVYVRLQHSVDDLMLLENLK